MLLEKFGLGDTAFRAAFQRLDFLEELTDVLEMSVDGRITDVCDFIEAV
jgi:hypothetical protein